LKVLHPTPAVCGLPKEKAYRFIKENEGYDRNYYSGFVGMLNPLGKTDLYVNLRCLNYKVNELSLYAGSGLLSASELEDEWQETEKKLQTMKRLLFSE
jgi:isochorismate synthase